MSGVQVFLRVMRLDERRLGAFAFGTAAELQAFVARVVDAELAVWSLTFTDPTFARLWNLAPPSHHLDRPARPPMAERFEALLVWQLADDAGVRDGLDSCVAGLGAWELDEDHARRAWDDRFQIMRIKRVGPSLVPTEFVLPLAGFAAALDALSDRIALPLALEGTILGGGGSGPAEVVVLGFIPHDERKFSFHLAFGLALSAMAVAAEHGGRPYATGVFFRHLAPAVLGPARAARLARAKTDMDLAGVFNPGKVLGVGLVNRLIQVATVAEPVVRWLGNRAGVEPGERFGKPVRGIPADVAHYAYACTGCGFCIDECDQYYGRGWESQTPRGRWNWLRAYMEGRAEIDPFMVDAFLACTTCELCHHRCCAELPIEPSWMKLRGVLIHEQKRMTFPPFEIMTAAVKAEGDIWAGYRKDRAAWFPDDLRERHGPSHRSKNVYFAGCTASYVERDIGVGTVRLLDEAGVDFSYLGERESCCATPMLVAGKWDVFVETMKDNLRSMEEAGADTVITSCPACDLMWRKVYPEWAEKLGIPYDLTTRHYSEMIADRIEDGSFTIPAAPAGTPASKVTWHDSCHIGRASGVYEPPRTLIRATPGLELVEMAHNRESAHCCGSVLTLIKDPDVAEKVGNMRLQEALDVGAEKVLSLCPCCEFQLRVSAEKSGAPLEIVDLSRFVAERFGYTLPDPHPEVRAQWAVFERMIALMTPEGFAELMGSMWPELVDAMPLGLGGVMRAMGRVEGALGRLAPLFPVLFPVLLPRMMPKVMATMLDRVTERVPMPAYMAEQMPGLMPGVMDSLMPHMIGDLVPLVTDDLIAYLEGDRV